MYTDTHRRLPIALAAVTILFTLVFHTADASPVQRLYDVTIHTGIKATLDITVDDSVVYGTLQYLKSKSQISVIGGMNGNLMVLHELLDDGTVSGVHSVTGTKDTLEGEWFGTTKKERRWKLVMVLKSEKSIAKPQLGNITGTYLYKYPDGSEMTGELLVLQTKPGAATVYINCNRGKPSYNMAIIDKKELKLISNGTTALYKNDEYGKCRIRIVFVPGGVRVEHIEEGYECGFGNASSVEGNYIRTSTEKPKFPTN